MMSRVWPARRSRMPAPCRYRARTELRAVHLLRKIPAYRRAADAASAAVALSGLAFSQAIAPVRSLAAGPCGRPAARAVASMATGASRPEARTERVFAPGSARSGSLADAQRIAVGPADRSTWAGLHRTTVAPRRRWVRIPTVLPIGSSMRSERYAGRWTVRAAAAEAGTIIVDRSAADSVWSLTMARAPRPEQGSDARCQHIAARRVHCCSPPASEWQFSEPPPRRLKQPRTPRLGKRTKGRISRVGLQHDRVAHPFEARALRPPQREVC